MGTVYRARDKVLDREVALKTIRTGTDVEPELRERFYREARACARLQHPNIITVYDLGEVDQIAFIAMELLEGLDFRQIIEQRKDLPVVLKIEVMAEVCEALAYAHARGIIHRDIKPSNLFLRGMQCSKVLDFGIARLPSSHLTVAGRILGTPNYMAPEQILSRPSDGRSDLFSAAIVFFELLAYAHPFKSQLIPRRIVDSEPDSLFDHDSKLPTLLEGVFARALAKEPSERYQSGDEFAADLRTISEAMRHNASPTFSEVRLPSDRIPKPIALAQAVAADLSLLTPTPPGEDPYEWRFSEVLRIIPEFDQAMDAGDTVGARKILAQLEAVEAVDDRFSAAVERCRKLVAETPPSSPAPSPLQSRPKTSSQTIEAATETIEFQPEQIASTTEDPPSARKYCIQCGALNRKIAQFCIECGASFLEQTAQVEQPPRATPSPEQGERTRLYTPEPRAKAFWEYNWDEWKNYSSWTVQQKQVAIAAVGFAILLVLLCLLVAILRPEVVEPAVAWAIVRPPKAFLYKQPNQGRIVTLSQGNKVQILRLPISRDQWVRAQFVTPSKTFRAGSMRALDLERWDSSNCDAALKLRLLFGFEGEIEALQRLIDRCPGSLHAASMEIAKLEIPEIKRRADAGEARSGWEDQLKKLQDRLRDLSDEDRKEIERKLAELPAEAASTAPLLPSAPVTINSLIQRARALYNDGDLHRAKSLIDAALRIQKSNPNAIALRDTIQAALDAESTIH